VTGPDYLARFHVILGNMVRDGISERVAMALSGRKTSDVFGRYNIVRDGDLRTSAQTIKARIEREMGTFLSTNANFEAPAKRVTDRFN
jgi:hypothetical protein